MNPCQGYLTSTGSNIMKQLTLTDILLVSAASGPCSGSAFGHAAEKGAVGGAIIGLFGGIEGVVPGAVAGAAAGLMWQAFDCAGG